MSNNNNNSSIIRCAACKSLRRKCPRDCVLKPYFPSNDPQRFSNVHKIFGSSNITKLLQQLPFHLRRDAVDSMAFEANLRVEDPVYGCVRIIFQLQQQITEIQDQLLKTECQIAVYNAQKLQKQKQWQQWQQQQQQQEVFHVVEPFPWMCSSQQNDYQKSHF